MTVPTEAQEKLLVEALKDARKFFEDVVKTNFTYIIAIAASLAFKFDAAYSKSLVGTIPVLLFATFFALAAAKTTRHIGGKFRTARLCLSKLTPETKSYTCSMALDE